MSGLLGQPVLLSFSLRDVQYGSNQSHYNSRFAVHCRTLRVDESLSSLRSANAQIQPIGLSFPYRTLNGLIEQGPIFRLDRQQHVSELGFLRARRKTKNMKCLGRPTYLIIDEVELPIADAGQLLNLDQLGPALGCFALSQSDPGPFSSQKPYKHGFLSH